MGVGTTVDAIQAGAGQQLPARVSEERRLGDFATWRAARAVGDYDLNTFYIRAHLENQSTGPDPGMTVFLPDPAGAP